MYADFAEPIKNLDNRKASHRYLALRRGWQEGELRVTMEADDVEAIKRMVEAGFGYSILPQFALGGRGRSFQKLRVPGRRLARQQALAMPKSAYPRALTVAVADRIQAALGTLRVR